MRIVLLLLLPPLLIFCFALIVIWVPLPRPLPPALSSERNLMAAVVSGVLGMAYLVGLVVYVLSVISLAGRVLDPVFTARGLASQPYVLLGRQYHGPIDGRQVDVQFTPAQVLQPALLHVYVAADLGARVAIGVQKPLLDCRDCTRIEASDPDFGALQVFAQQESWARRLLGDPASRATLSRLMGDQARLGSRELYIQPERIWLRAHPSARVTGAEIAQWLDDTLALAGSAKGIGAP